jgi:hypothetical protein
MACGTCDVTDQVVVSYPSSKPSGSDVGTSKFSVSRPVLLAFENLKAKNKCQWSVILSAIHATLVLKASGSVPGSGVVF